MVSYSLSGHGSMVSDRGRVAAYVRALEKTVKPGCLVAELGAGTGVFSLLACRLGARRVYAIEADSIIQVGREAAAANGFADRIVFIQDVSTRVELPERCDVIVSDLHGILPWFGLHIPSIADARQRFLASGGVLIPQRETLWAAVVEAPKLHSRLLGPWTQNPFGFDMRAARQLSIHGWLKTRVKPGQLLTEHKQCAVLDFMTVTDPHLDAGINWNIARAGTGSGVVVWFDSVLCEDTQFSNSPFTPELIFGSAFYPWPEQVPLQRGDRICLELKARLVGGEYVWRWETRIFQSGGGSEPTSHFQQSTFFGTPFSLEALRKTNGEFAANLGEEGQVELFILAGMNGRTSNAELARRLAEKFPKRFTSKESAFDRVTECSRKYGK